MDDYSASYIEKKTISIKTNGLGDVIKVTHSLEDNCPEYATDYSTYYFKPNNGVIIDHIHYKRTHTDYLDSSNDFTEENDFDFTLSQSSSSNGNEYSDDLYYSHSLQTIETDNYSLFKGINYQEEYEYTIIGSVSDCALSIVGDTPDIRTVYFRYKDNSLGYIRLFVLLNSSSELTYTNVIYKYEKEITVDDEIEIEDHYATGSFGLSSPIFYPFGDHYVHCTHDSTSNMSLNKTYETCKNFMLNGLLTFDSPIYSTIEAYTKYGNFKKIEIWINKSLAILSKGIRTQSSLNSNSDAKLSGNVKIFDREYYYQCPTVDLNDHESLKNKKLHGYLDIYNIEFVNGIRYDILTDHPWIKHIYINDIKYNHDDHRVFTYTKNNFYKQLYKQNITTPYARNPYIWIIYNTNEVIEYYSGLFQQSDYKDNTQVVHNVDCLPLLLPYTFVNLNFITTTSIGASLANIVDKLTNWSTSNTNTKAYKYKEITIFDDCSKNKMIKQLLSYIRTISLHKNQLILVHGSHDPCGLKDGGYAIFSDGQILGQTLLNLNNLSLIFSSNYSLFCYSVCCFGSDGIQIGHNDYYNSFRYLNNNTNITNYFCIMSACSTIVNWSNSDVQEMFCNSSKKTYNFYYKYFCNYEKKIFSYFCRLIFNFFNEYYDILTQNIPSNYVIRHSNNNYTIERYAQQEWINQKEIIWSDISQKSMKYFSVYRWKNWRNNSEECFYGSDYYIHLGFIGFVQEVFYTFYKYKKSDNDILEFYFGQSEQTGINQIFIDALDDLKSKYQRLKDYANSISNNLYTKEYELCSHIARPSFICQGSFATDNIKMFDAANQTAVQNLNYVIENYK